ncbi:MAG: cytochrome c [Stagnimonas sp.]|nr:cytochrome c [Stagnimonas sp.]
MTRILFAALALTAATAQAAPEVAKPDKTTTCAACHGEAGVSAIGMYPTLAGQYANYLEHSLKDYRSGARKNAIMGAQAANLTDAEIKQLALWYAAQKGPLYTPSVHGDLKP